jgi:hypothetical protein
MQPGMTARLPADQRKLPARELTEAELEARRANATRSTGPRTEDGKARSSRNAWRHGLSSRVQLQAGKMGAESMAKLFGKPCLTTCPVHPDNPDRTEAPCNLVLEGLTGAGGNCLDKTVYVHAYAALLDAMENGVMDGMQAMLAAEGAAALQLIHQLRTELTQGGMLMIDQFAVNKEGELVLNPLTGQPVLMDRKMPSGWGVLIGMIDKLGISLPEMLATPQARSRAKLSEDTGDALTTVLGALMRQGQQQLPPGSGRDPLEPDK